jgi:hypothetical protein
VEELLLPATEFTWSSDGRQIEIHTAELLICEPSPFEVESAIVNLKNYK